MTPAYYILYSGLPIGTAADYVKFPIGSGYLIYNDDDRKIYDITTGQEFADISSVVPTVMSNKSSYGGSWYFIDSSNNIQTVDLSTGTLSDTGDNSAYRDSANGDQAYSLYIDQDAGNLYHCVLQNSDLRVYKNVSGTRSTLYSNGSGILSNNASSFAMMPIGAVGNNNAFPMEVGRVGDTLYIATYGYQGGTSFTLKVDLTDDSVSRETISFSQFSDAHGLGACGIEGKEYLVCFSSFTSATYDVYNSRIFKAMSTGTEWEVVGPKPHSTYSTQVVGCAAFYIGPDEFFVYQRASYSSSYFLWGVHLKPDGSYTHYEFGEYPSGSVFWPDASLDGIAINDFTSTQMDFAVLQRNSIV